MDASISLSEHGSEHMINVLVLMGGPDAERQVSLMSGREVAAALRESRRCSVVEQVIDRPGAPELRDMVKRAAAEVVFPVLHGRWGEGGALQRELDLIGMPYVGCGPRAAELAMDKLATKALIAAEGVPTPPACRIQSGDRCEIDAPVVLKPIDDGSSVDLRICRSREAVDRARRELHPKRGPLMAETYIRGRELTVGIVLDQLLPIIEIIPPEAVEFYDFESKYTRDDTRYELDPSLPPGVAERCARIAMTAYQRLACRDIARIDLMLDERAPWFLEINTMPGFTTHSLVPMAARHVGIEMPDLCARLVEAAMRRGESPSVKASHRTMSAIG